MKPARPEDIPQATHEGTLDVLGFKLRTYRLDDGRTVIHAEDFEKFMEAWLSPDPNLQNRTPGD